LDLLQSSSSYDEGADVMWLGGEDQETWLGYDGPGYKSEGQVGGFSAMNRTWQRSLSKDLVPMYQGNSEKQEKL